MQITPIGYVPRPTDLAQKKPVGDQSNPFAEALSGALKNVTQLQSQADDIANQVALGKNVDLHQAVLATEEASLAFQYTLQVRNRLIEAYQEVMRMQV